MKRRAFIALVIFAAACFVPCTAGVAQAQRGGQAKASPVPSGPVYTTTPFDPAVDSLPKSYAGMNCVRIVAALKQLPLKKSQFETTAAYDQRIAALSETNPLYGSIKMSDLLAFKIRIRPEVERTYDADKGVLTITWPPLPGAFYGTAGDINMKVYESAVVTSSTTSSYVGSNAFGVKRAVRRTVNRVCGVMNGEKAEFIASDRDHTGPGGTSITMSGAEAQAFLKQPGVILIGKLETPFHLVGVDSVVS